MMWTVFAAASDCGVCNSVQAIECEASDAQSAARNVFEGLAWLKDFSLIAVIPWSQDIYLRDDSRTGEYGLIHSN